MNTIQDFRKHIRNSFDISEKKQINLEKGIFNAALREATQRNIDKNWSNPDFKETYLNIFRGILSSFSRHYYWIVSNDDILAHMPAFDHDEDDIDIDENDSDEIKFEKHYSTMLDKNNIIIYDADDDDDDGDDVEENVRELCEEKYEYTEAELDVWNKYM